MAPGEGALSYFAALLIGLAAAAYFLPLATILGSGGLWVSPGGDLAENLTGHLAFQATGWTWPLLLTPNLAWPHGTSIAMTDSNPLISLIAKVVAKMRGEPINLFGIWLATCWILQPVAAVYALRGFHCRALETAIAAAILAVLFPALLARVSHINLMGHFLLLLALGVSLRTLDAKSFSPRRCLAVMALLSVTALCHPYLYVFSAAVIAAPALQAMIDRQANAKKSIAAYLAAVVAPIALYAMLSGTLGGSERGFGFYSMNLLSPFWPQHSGLFGAERPIIDATGGQYEGYNYLGAGGLLLLAVAATVLAVLRWRWGWPPNWNRSRALVIILVALTLLALSSRIYLGHILVLSLGIKPWDELFGAIQASGRAFWLVGYALVLGALAIVTSFLPRPGVRILLVVAVVLQVIDTAPLRAAAQDYFVGRDQVPAPVAPLPDAFWLTLVPVCTHPGPPSEVAGKLRLNAIQAGMWLRDMRVSRLPRWFNCESALTDGLETPLVPKEMRVFLEAPATTLFRQAALGAEAICGSIEAMIVCTRGLPLAIGTPIAPGPALPALSLPAPDVSGQALKPLYSYGLKEDEGGLAWSEGPRASLLFRVAPLPQTGTFLLRLRIDGIARSIGGARPISVKIDGAAPIDVDLPDVRPTTVDLRVAAGSVAEGTMRVVFDIDHPVDPRARNLAAPVGRAGLRLYALSVSLLEAPAE
jgi:hypothetical protein